TIASTTEAETTGAQTTIALTTEAQTTVAPTTIVSTTEAETTEASTTKFQTSKATITEPSKTTPLCMCPCVCTDPTAAPSTITTQPSTATTEIPIDTTTECICTTYAAPVMTTARTIQCRQTEAIACIDGLKDLIANGSDGETVCREIEATRECISNKTFSCDQNTIQGAWAYFNSTVSLERRQQCYVKINCTDFIEVIEGGGPKYMELDIRTSPTQICRDNNLDDDCLVSVTFDLELGAQPACRNKDKTNKETTIVSQAVFGEHTYSKGDSTCG
ncbi:unnamed protein product, partial [Owenia fusiformis]